jgi:hypothetical protein
MPRVVATQGREGPTAQKASATQQAAGPRDPSGKTPPHSRVRRRSTKPPRAWRRLRRVSASLKGPALLSGFSVSLEAALDPRPRTSSPDQGIKCSDASRAPGSKANPRRVGPLTPPGNHILVLYSHPGTVGEGRCHSMTLCRLLPYLLHIVPLERGRWYPRKRYGHQLHTRPGRRHNVRPAGRVFSITSGPARPSPPLCRHPRHCRVIPNTVETQVDRTSSRTPLCRLRSSVSQALKLAYGQRSNKSAGATTLEAAPGRA